MKNYKKIHLLDYIKMFAQDNVGFIKLILEVILPMVFLFWAQYNKKTTKA